MQTILAVDDNQDDLFLLERTLSLSGIGHRLLTAGDGVEAEAILDSIEKGKRHSFASLIFVDIHMPRLDGFQPLARFKREPRRAAIPVVMLSSFDDPGVMGKAFELGATACLHKLPALEEVRRVVKRAGDASRRLQDSTSPRWAFNAAHDGNFSAVGALPATHNGTVTYGEEGWLARPSLSRKIPKNTNQQSVNV